ncbi:hypothetical protein [Rhodopirellula sallentina]|uniref:Uncharacterized protein n=1 Tax=Rhodopirellula sallentina SM41 TaxID=1263870 RepID=M5TZS9_9BACT|nr:hypothetical protein [Rhodopirellula sallentina]EMI54549.1 hypothetical protein RSSM_04020 [Rhodopirellula sallentina SM41]
MTNPSVTVTFRVVCSFRTQSVIRIRAVATSIRRRSYGFDSEDILVPNTREGCLTTMVDHWVI